MLIINIVRDVKPIRMGVWTSATSTARCLRDDYGTESEIWFPGETYGYEFDSCKSIQLKSTGLGTLRSILSSRQLDPGDTVVVAHSPWGYQTNWMRHFSENGFRTMFVPHGTLEPWSLSQKALKKKLYFHTIEKRNIITSHIIRALSKPEYANLNNMFPAKVVELIPNGVEQISPRQKSDDIIQVLFIGRLHHKKGLVELINGWSGSTIARSDRFKLVIAGPDEGELPKIKSLIDQTKNITYAGPLYGIDKEKTLLDSHYFILPSASEGFPVAVLEAAEYGLCPIISQGCNFPELLTNKMAIEVKKNSGDVASVLDKIIELSEVKRMEMVTRLRELIGREYSLQAIGLQQHGVYTKMLNS